MVVWFSLHNRLLILPYLLGHMNIDVLWMHVPRHDKNTAAYNACGG